MIHNYNIDDKILIFIYDFDTKGYDRYEHYQGIILNHIEDYGYNIRLKEPVYFEIIPHSLTKYSEPVAESGETRFISVAYNQILDHISRENSLKWTALDAIKHRWQNLIFRFIKPMNLTTYKKSPIRDDYSSNISYDYYDYNDFSISNCWFTTNVNNNNISLSFIIVGIIDVTNSKYSRWSYCSYRLLDLYNLIFNSCNKHKIEQFKKKDDIYTSIFRYLFENIEMPKKYKQDFEQTILWFK